MLRSRGVAPISSSWMLVALIVASVSGVRVNPDSMPELQQESPVAGIESAAVMLEEEMAFNLDGKDVHSHAAAVATAPFQQNHEVQTSLLARFPMSCNAVSAHEVVHELAVKGEGQDLGGGCLADGESRNRGAIIGCQASCQCGWVRQCYPKVVLVYCHAAGSETVSLGSRVNVGVCEIAMPLLIMASASIFVFMLGCVVTIRMYFQLCEEHEKPQLVKASLGPHVRADLSLRHHQGRNSVPITEWPRAEQDEASDGNVNDSGETSSEEEGPMDVPEQAAPTRFHHHQPHLQVGPVSHRREIVTTK